MIYNILSEHTAFKSQGLIGTPGYSIPVFKDPQRLELSKDNEAPLAAYGITIDGSYGEGNYIHLDRGMPPIKLKLHSSLRSGSHFVIENGSNLSATLSMGGANHIFCCGKAGPNRFNLQATFRGNGCGLFIGQGGTCHSLDLWLEGEGNSIHIGDDALFSWGIWMRLGDGHGMIDLDTRRLINTPESIAVGPHVWLGQEAMLMKGATVGAGSMIGARSVITKTIPPFSVAAGVPAKIIRENASWTRQSIPDDEQMDELLGRGYMRQP